MLAAVREAKEVAIMLMRVRLIGGRITGGMEEWREDDVTDWMNGRTD